MREFSDAIDLGWRSRLHGLRMQITVNISRHRSRRIVATRPVFIHCLHDNPVQITTDERSQSIRLDLSQTRNRRESVSQGRKAVARNRRFFFHYDATNFVIPSGVHSIAIDGRRSCQKFVEQYAEGIDIASCVDIECIHFRLFGTHVQRSSHQRHKTSVDGFIGQALTDRFCNTEVDNLGNRFVIVERR